jgi:hypothetical protein
MNWSCKPARAIFVILASGVVFFAPRASAQSQTPANTVSPEPKETASDPGWHASITPYIWFSGLHGTVGVLDHEASVHASFGDIFNYLNIGLMGQFEVRHDRVVMPVDFLWMKLSDNKALPIDEEAESAKAKMTETILTPKIGYRFVDKKRLKMDAVLGFRYWHLTNSVTLQPEVEGGRFSHTADWVDGVGGARIEASLTPKVSLIVAGDAGGGSARSDYQVAGLLGYKISRRWVLLGGYRYLSVNYRPAGEDRFIYDVTMPGLILGATFNIK